jgi:hypothetical protein
VRKAVALVVVGAAFVIAAVAVFVIVPQQKPQTIASMKARDGSPTCLPYGLTGLEGMQS